MMFIFLLCYQLTLHVQSPGLFCVFNTVLAALDDYDRGIIDGLHVDFEDQGLYYDKKVGLNWWEYYFEPIRLGKEASKKFPQYKKTIYALKGEFEIPLERANELIKKYIKIKPALQEKIDEIYANQFKGHDVIGVHYRGTDKKSEAPKVSYEEAYWKIDEVVREKNFKNLKIFLATDDGKFFEFLKEKYPDQLFGMDAMRSKNGKPVHFAKTVENYRKGEEAIIDAILLSKCQFLIKTASNLSQCSREFNPSIPTVQMNVCYYSE